MRECVDEKNKMNHRLQTTRLTQITWITQIFTKVTRLTSHKINGMNENRRNYITSLCLGDLVAELLQKN